MIVVASLLGLIFGSFVNAMVWRLHAQSDYRLQITDYRRKSRDEEFHNLKSKINNLSILRGRSQCPHCHHRLSVVDLFPVISWIILRGRCRYCHKSISIQYPAVELLTALVFTLLTWHFRDALGSAQGILSLITWLASSVVLIALAVYDLRWLLLPNVLIYPLLGVGVLYTVLTGIVQGSFYPISEALVGLVVLGGLFWAIFELSKGTWLGGGDVKLAAFLGLMLGWQKGLLTIVLASWLGLAAYIVLVLARKPRRLLPFGPFLIVAAYLCLVAGRQAIDWYLRLSGLL